MANDGHRGELPIAGGALALIAGVFQVVNGAVLVAFFLTWAPYHSISTILPFPWSILFPGFWADYLNHYYTFSSHPPGWLMIMGALLLVLGVLAVAGGVSAIRRRSFGLSLAGAISALLSGLFGVLAVIFVGLARKEFGAR